MGSTLCCLLAGTAPDSQENTHPSGGCSAIAVMSLIFEANARVLQNESESSEDGDQKMLGCEERGVKDLYSRPAAVAGAFRCLSVALRSAPKPDCAPLQDKRLLKN